MSGKYIFVTGGVCSGLGKGVAASSIGSLLENRGLKVRMIKIDPYINVDPGTMSPYQHGEVYVTDDGAETDLDLGNYSRFTSAPLGRINSVTTGQVYQEVIRREREGRFLGRTVQVIPHITDEIKSRIFRVGDQPEVDVTIIEIGGTVGDIESIPFLETARQFIHDLGRQRVLFVHLTLIPIVSDGEMKTKPTQHSVASLRQIGIQPDILLCRASVPVPEELRRKISLFTNVEDEAVISAYDVHSTVYEIPLIFAEQKLDEIILAKLGFPATSCDLSKWQRVVEAYNAAERRVSIGLVGKYTELLDSYKSIYEALYHGGIDNHCQIELVKVDSDQLSDGAEGGLEEILSGLDGILIPGGFGQRGIEGMIQAAGYARRNRLPCFGICLGMQVMVIEYARGVLGWEDASSSEFSPESKHAVVSLLEDQIDVKAYGGTMRLGASPSRVVPGTKLHEIYGRTEISERHRHRYEVANVFREDLVKAGLIFSAFTPDNSLVEASEWPDHPWGIGVQYHPEFKSKPIAPHPLFSAFVAACMGNESS
ncbi:MAG: CTP synthase [Spirochaetales bacterium]|nr:CTP synthase [Spirochaetales bacterium]